MWRCFVRDQARVPSVAGAVAPFFVTGTVFFPFTLGLGVLFSQTPLHATVQKGHTEVVAEPSWVA